MASCSADISNEKKPTMPPLTVPIWPSARNSPAQALGDVIGDVGGERGLAHAGAAGKDNEIGSLQAAHAIVEIVQSGGEPRKTAVALIRARRHVDRGRESLGEALEPGIIAPGLRDFVKLALGVFDMARRRGVDWGVVRNIDHFLADRDQVAADREVVDGAAVILGIDDGGRFGGEPGQILIE